MKLIIVTKWHGGFPKWRTFLLGCEFVKKRQIKIIAERALNWSK